MKYFKNVANVKELKAEYKKLARKHHPDMGGRCRSNEENQRRI